MKVMTDDDLAGVDLGALIAALRAAHVDHALGRAVLAVPHPVPTGPDTVLIPMIATWRGLTAVKILTDARGGAGPAQQSTILILDAATGTRLAVLGGGRVTRERTAATTAVATDALARPEARVLGLVGAGPLAVEHVAALRRVRDLAAVHVWTRTEARLEDFRTALRKREAADGVSPIAVHAAPDPRAAVEAADVLCTVTPARTPVVEGAWFHPGLHVNAVGAPPRADHREIDSAGMARATVVLDSREIQLAESGEVRLALADGSTTEAHYGTELGAVLAGLAPGRTSAAEITLFDSVGVALQDLAYAALALGRLR
jgi:alanine dehydrogenase